MIRARIANKNQFLLNTMSSLTVRLARVNGVLVVEAPTDGVSFDELVTHSDGIDGDDCFLVCLSENREGKRETGNGIK